MTDRERQKVRRLRAVYDSLPSANCRGLCEASCGPIFMFPLEARQVERALGRVPLETVETACPALVNGRCSVYDVRPIICRLYGAVEGMRCEHGCVPDRLMTDDEAKSVMDRVEAICGKGVVPSHSEKALARAIREARAAGLE